MVTPYDNDRGKAEQVKEMFDAIAPAYDFMNRAMTMGVDKLWRRRAVKIVAKSAPRSIIDIATGTGDLAIAMARRIAEAHISGLDLSEGMVAIGRRKVAAAGLEARISMAVGDCCDPSVMPEGAADDVTVAYGIRNFADIAAGYRAMHRMLKPGGMICVVELSTPQGWLTRPLYNFYTRHIIPGVGRLVSHDVRAYSYLPESIAAAPQRRQMLQLMEDAGFSDARYISLTFGTCTIYTARRQP